MISVHPDFETSGDFFPSCPPATTRSIATTGSVSSLLWKNTATSKKVLPSEFPASHFLAENRGNSFSRATGCFDAGSCQRVLGSLQNCSLLMMGVEAARLAIIFTRWSRRLSPSDGTVGWHRGMAPWAGTTPEDSLGPACFASSRSRMQKPRLQTKRGQIQPFGSMGSIPR